MSVRIESATTFPDTDTTTLLGFLSIVMGCSALGNLTVFIVLISVGVDFLDRARRATGDDNPPIRWRASYGKVKPRWWRKISRTFVCPSASACGFAAVDIQDVAGHEARIIGSEIQNGAGDLVRLTNPLLGVERREIGLDIFASGEPIEHRRLDWSRRHRIDANAGGTELERNRLRQPFDRMF